MKTNKIIAVTGGIGTGKSTVCDILCKKGYVVFSSDQIVSDLYKKRSVRKILKNLFPTAVKGIFLKIDRKEISKIVFNDKDKLALLTSAITPLVLKEILRRYKNLTGVCFAEVPLLFECSYQNEFDGVLIISRPLKDRIESVKKRSNLTEEEIISRINAQFNYDIADLKDYTVIINDDNLEGLEEKINDYLNTI